jgi:hypothetical protein
MSRLGRSIQTAFQCSFRNTLPSDRASRSPCPRDILLRRPLFAADLCPEAPKLDRRLDFGKRSTFLLAGSEIPRLAAVLRKAFLAVGDEPPAENQNRRQPCRDFNPISTSIPAPVDSAMILLKEKRTVVAGEK